MTEPMTDAATTTDDATMTDAPMTETRTMTEPDADAGDDGCAVARPVAAGRRARASALVAALTLEEKLAQLYGIWIGASDDGGDVGPAPARDERRPSISMRCCPRASASSRGPSAPRRSTPRSARSRSPGCRSASSPRAGSASRRSCTRSASPASPRGGATAYPVPLSWGATFDPELVEQMARRIGADMRSVGVHQGLAPVLDVVRDARWGRVEETIGEDPYLVGTIGTAYVRGLESAGVVATLKHFVGYSASRAGRNLAPVSVGARELADVLLPPFEMAVRDGGARSVMNAYTDLDGVPVGRRPRAAHRAAARDAGASRAPSSPTTSRSRS